MIKAECHSDDRCIEAKFDATPWFEQAKEDDVQALVGEGWGSGYASDAIATFMADEKAHPEICEMFKYIELRGRIETIGYSCSVNKADALAWVKANRPDWKIEEE